MHEKDAAVLVQVVNCGLERKRVAVSVGRMVCDVHSAREKQLQIMKGFGHSGAAARGMHSNAFYKRTRDIKQCH